MADGFSLRHPPQLIPSSSKPSQSQLAKQKQPPPEKKKQHFPSHLDAPNVSPRARILCEVLTKAPLHDIDSALSATGISPLPEIVEEVLKLSYGSPSAAVKFFRWAGLSHKPSAYGWNLMVDLLGKNEQFEPMWDAIRSMKQEGVLTMATFVSVFGSYCVASRFNEAIMTFDVMDRYGIQPDVVAVNSLLSAICREDNQTSMALTFFDKIKTSIPPDGDTFAILLEGWEKEGNAAKAKHTFGEMVIRVGWSPQNMSAYDAFLTTLVRDAQVEEAIKFLQVMKKQNCLPGKFFYEMIKNECPPTHANCAAAIAMQFEGDDPEMAIEIWNYMIENRILPLDESANALLIGLRNMDRLSELRRFADDMLDRGVNIYESTMGKLKVAFYKEGRGARDTYDSLLRRWKAA